MKFKPIHVLVSTVLLMSSLCYAGPLPILYLDHVVAIGRKDTTPGPNFGKWMGEATGFLYGEFDHMAGLQNKAYIIYLVTNRHVIEEPASPIAHIAQLRAGFSIVLLASDGRHGT